MTTQPTKMNAAEKELHYKNLGLAAAKLFVDNHSDEYFSGQESFDISEKSFTDYKVENPDVKFSRRSERSYKTAMFHGVRYYQLREDAYADYTAWINRPSV